MPPDRKDKNRYARLTKKHRSNHTTIWVSKKVKAQLDKIRGKTSYNACLVRILNQEIEVWFDLISVDGEPPKGHEVIFKLGDSLYNCKDGTTKEITGLRIIPVGTEENAEKT